MKRHEFIKTTVLGLGTISLPAIVSANTLKNNNIKEFHDVTPVKLLRKGEGRQQIVLGDRQIVKLTGSDTNDQYTLIELNNRPGMEIPLHVHQDEDEVFHVLEGALEIQIGKTIKVLKMGDIIFCPRGIPHSWKVIGDQNARVMLSIFPSGLEHMFDEMAKLPEGPPNFEDVAKICKKYNIQFV